MVSVRQDFVSVGCNRVVNALDWGDHGYVAFGGHYMAVVYDPKQAEIVSTLVGHTGQVNCVLWVPSQLTPDLPAGSALLLSGSTDASIHVWLVEGMQVGSSKKVTGRPVAVLQGHTGPVTSLAVYPLSQGSYMLASSAGDEAVRIWSCSSAASASYGQAYSQWSLLQAISVGSHLKYAVALTHLPRHPDWTLLATGGTDSMVHLYVRPPSGCFALCCKLSGHENWVRSISFCHVDREAERGHSDEVLLASASQDRYGRVWSVRLTGTAPEASTSSAENNPLAQKIARYAPKPMVSAEDFSYSITLEALLIGHDDWVHSICWRQLNCAQGIQSQSVAHTPGRHIPQRRTEMTLLTSSMDRSMILWKYQAGSGLWMNQAAIGDAGASCLGYFGAAFSPDTRFLMAHGFTGALHLWECQPGAAGTSLSWEPRHAAGGHFGVVADACWGVDGQCLMTVSTDQTARMWTPVGGAQHWCEIARTQVHGHDFTCVASVPCPAASNPSEASVAPSSFMYVSGSEEKILRAFEAPGAFLDTLDMARGRAAGTTSTQMGTSSGKVSGGRALGAAVAALGLSNKAVYQDVGSHLEMQEDEHLDPNAPAKLMDGADGGGGGDYTEGPDLAPSCAPAAVSGPPLEEHLSQNTLWPEVHKLYGHGNDVFCVAASPDGKYLASACVAKTPQAAAIWVWRTAGGGWRAVTQLQSHTLTVTHLAWSHDGSYLAACSRDRSFSIFKRSPPGSDGSEEDSFSLIHKVKAAHARVIWGASWSHDDTLLATGARDGVVKVWSMGDGGSLSENTGGDSSTAPQPGFVLPTFPAAVTALAFSRGALQPSTSEASSMKPYLLALGLESGVVQLWSFSCSESRPVADSMRCLWVSDESTCHAAAINAICWRPVGPGEESAQLATCGDDHAVRVFSCLA